MLVHILDPLILLFSVVCSPIASISVFQQDFWHLSCHHQCLECIKVLHCHAPVCCVATPISHSRHWWWRENTFIKTKMLHAGNWTEYNKKLQDATCNTQHETCIIVGTNL